MPMKTRRWTRVEYERLVEHGFLGRRDPIELLDGLMVVREPQGNVHGSAVAAAYAFVRRAFARTYHVRVQLPVALDSMSEPEPDLAVVLGDPWDYRTGHPQKPVLVVEIAVSSLALDRRVKGELYARARIREYWIVNLADEVLEVYRQPIASARSRYGWKYRSVQLLRRGAAIRPLAARRSVSVTDLLPPR